MAESTHDHLFKLLIIGDSGVGKSSILLRFCDDEFNEKQASTIGVDFKTKFLQVRGKKLKLALWDTAGQERFRTLTSSYYRGAQGIILCYDCTQRSSFEHVKFWQDEVRKYSTNQDAILMLVSNKVDLADQQVTRTEGEEFAFANSMMFIETSAKTRPVQIHVQRKQRPSSMSCESISKRFWLEPCISQGRQHRCSCNMHQRKFFASQTEEKSRFMLARRALVSAMATASWQKTVRVDGWFETEAVHVRVSSFYDFLLRASGRALLPLFFQRIRSWRSWRSLRPSAILACSPLSGVSEAPEAPGPGQNFLALRHGGRLSGKPAERAPIFLVRHGQSTWNLAAKRLDLWTMFRQVDHALTAEGVEQASRLRSSTQTARRNGDIDAEQFLSPQSLVFASPLSRAVATSIVALGLERKITLLPDARELAYPWCGPDSIGAATGGDIAERALQDLSKVDSAYSQPPMAEEAVKMIDASAATGIWWSRFRESKGQMQQRLQSLLSRLRPADSPSPASILVCHSLLIQRLFKDFASLQMEADMPELLSQLRASKLQNCGVVKVLLDDNKLASRLEPRRSHVAQLRYSPVLDGTAILTCQDEASFKDLQRLLTANGLQLPKHFSAASGICPKRSVRSGWKGSFCCHDVSPTASFGLPPLDLQWQRLQLWKSVAFWHVLAIAGMQGIKTAFEEVVFKILDTPSLLQSTQPLGTRQVDAQNHRQASQEGCAC
ncbi:rab-18 [Symbiodinium sp. CCMP2592]|nr:rab-18 [Symbiodinium sp. CCMP2592]